MEKEYKEYIENEYQELSLSFLEYKRNENLVAEIVKFLKDNELEHDVLIFYNEKRLDLNNMELRQFDYDCYGSYCDEYSNDRTVTMVFEGAFNRLMNYPTTEWDFEKYQEFKDIVNKYNLFYELGNTYNLSMNEI